MSGASERANGRASGPVLTSQFLFVLDHSAALRDAEATAYKDANADADTDANMPGMTNGE